MRQYFSELQMLLDYIPTLHMSNVCLLCIRDQIWNRKEILPQHQQNLLRLFLRTIFFPSREKTLNPKWGTAIDTKFAQPYSILFMVVLEKEILGEIELKRYLWQSYRDGIFVLWGHGEEKLKEFMEHMNEKYPTIKFTSEWSQRSLYFQYATVSLIGGKVTADLYVKPKDSHQYLSSLSYHLYHCKKGIP